MQNIPNPDPSDKRVTTASRNLFQTASLACAIFLIPALLGVLFVFVSHRIDPLGTPPTADEVACLTNRLYDGSATNVSQLIALRRDLRNEGYATDGVNLRIWAAHISEPEVLFRVPPPDPANKWNWHISQNGMHAIAVSRQVDALKRRTVGLYDLVTEQWVWTNALPWPDTHEQPYVFDRHLVLRYSKNARRFALEVDEKGTIVALDALGTGNFNAAQALPPQPLFPGKPVAVKNGVFFTSDSKDDTLFGYAQEALPGLHYAGKGDANTIFSGNGRLKFTVAEGRVTVSDSLTQTVMQQIDAWPRDTNTLVTATLTTHDGSRLTVFLRTEFASLPPVTREWSVAVDLYTGTVIKSFNADALFAKPKRTASLQALSPDGQWQLSVDPSNVLTVTSLDEKREVARVSLAALGLTSPISHLVFLEEGRHVVLRQKDNFWLLDFSVAQRYGDLVSRMASSCCTNVMSSITDDRANQQPETETSGSTNEFLATSPEGYGVGAPFDPDLLSYASAPGTKVPSYFALRAEVFAANQAWTYAAALLEQTCLLQQYDTRAPRVNPLLLARYHLLSGQREKARLTSREALRELFADPTDYNRMIRYHLQGLLFAKP